MTAVLTISEGVAEAVVAPELGGGLRSYDLLAGGRAPLFRPCLKIADA